MNPLSDARRGHSRSRPNHHSGRKSDREIDTSPPHPQLPQQQPHRGTKFNDTNDQKKLQHAKDIWFRKSNIGYHCFIEYYKRSFWMNEEQPDEEEEEELNNDTVTTETTHGNDDDTMHGTRIGNSRAAKRRRKKQRTIHTDDGNGVPFIAPSTSSTLTTSAVVKRPRIADTIHTNHKIHPSHPLLLALQHHHQSILHKNKIVTSFFTTLSQPLPITFRIRRSCSIQHREELIQHIEAFNQSNTSSNVHDHQEALIIRPMFPNYNNRGVGSAIPNIEYYQCATSSKDVIVTLNRSRSSNSSSGTASPNVATTWNDLLIRYSQNGCIARQELGSMLPVLALQHAGYFHTGHPPSKAFAFLDMCSSPGSKLLQAVEIILTAQPFQLQQQQNRKKISGEQITPAAAHQSRSILCVANDVLQSRLDSLRNAVQRSGVQAATDTAIEQLITYTNQDATKFALFGSSSFNSSPTPIQRGSGGDAKKSTKSSTATELIRFNVILCDVPCSGDGTCRKDKHILPMFTPNIGNVLHVTQVKILYRALQLLHVNGCVCYSTCSLNPVEDEAVVAAAMIQYNRYSKSRSQAHQQSIAIGKGAVNHQESNKEKNDVKPSSAATTTYVELVDCPIFDNVKLRNGISQWSVAEYQHYHDDANDDSEDETDANQRPKQYLQWYDTYEDAVRRIGNNDGRSSTVLTPTLYPPHSIDHADIIQSLSKCQRLLPQDQDSGGFFFALIRKCDSLQG
jgi:16S rRNA C967 or C1407 C5-methylase (RsmB/RsmF family)